MSTVLVDVCGVSMSATVFVVRRDRVRLMSARVTAVSCGSGLVCVCQLVVLCAVDLVCRVLLTGVY